MNPLLQFFHAAVTAAMFHPVGRIPQFRGSTPGRNKGLRDKTGLPSGYPGAKLARKAIRSRLTLRG